MNDQSLNPYTDAAPAGQLDMPSTSMATAESQRAMAETQSAMVIAKKFPRDEKAAVDRILTECSRVGLAEKATYQFSRGGKDIFGPSIRLAETISRQWGNFQAGLIELTRSEGVSEVMAYACDLETNRWERVVFHVKHRRDTQSGGYELKTERDVYELIANQGARRKRSCILALIPGDVIEAALNQCDTTLKSKITVNEDTIKSMLEKFDKYGVTKDMVEKRIQRRVDANSITPGLLINLGKIFTSLEDGMSVASDWFDMGEDTTDLKGGDGDQKNGKTTKKNSKKKSKKSTADNAEPFTAIDVIGKIKGATSLDELDEAADLLRELPDDDRQSVQDAYDKKAKELKGDDPETGDQSENAGDQQEDGKTDDPPQQTDLVD